MTASSTSTRPGASRRTDPAGKPHGAVESAVNESAALDRPADRVHHPTTDERFYSHQLAVLSVSSGMVGVCLTAIGLIGIRKSIGGVESIVDDMLAVGSLLFMVTALFSFFAMRTRLSKAWRGIERSIDVVFSLGLVLVVVATALLTWEVF
ncbi:MAG: hypothetical protein MUF06_12265 [Pirellulaceae bacterium]|jgi:hypothetical protein|nr:hypothetical protein [Pirellulaceae bacterium]